MTRRLLLQSAAALAAAAQTRLSRSNIGAIDAHAHIDDTAPDAIWPRDAAALVEDMDRCGVRLAVFSHLSAIMAANADELRTAHDRSASAVRRYPDRLRAYVVFQPHLADASAAELGRILAPDSPFVGVKLHGPIHRYPVTGPAWARTSRTERTRRTSSRWRPSIPR
jgi:predicted TIM-barrel fold metal-dependent hydrolase